MTEKPLFCRRFRAISEQGAEALTRRDSPNQSDAVKEHRTMADCHLHNDSITEINGNKPETWQPIGAVAARLVEKARK